MFNSPPETIKAKCPECGEENEVLWFQSNKMKRTVSGTRAGTSIQWSGRGEKVQGNCKKCGYKFKAGDI